MQAGLGVSACDEIDVCGIFVTGRDTHILQIAWGNEGRVTYQIGMESDPTGERRHPGRQNRRAYIER